MEQIKHIAFIMDGNGRWANERNLPRHLGHKEGVANVEKILLLSNSFANSFTRGTFGAVLFSICNYTRAKSEKS